MSNEPFLSLLIDNNSFSVMMEAFLTPFLTVTGWVLQKLEWPIDANDGNLGFGASPDGSSGFAGWIDDLRFYQVALHPRKSWSPMAKVRRILVPLNFWWIGRLSVMPITVTVSFQDKNQNAVPISGFELDDDLVGGVASNLQPSGLNYTFEVNATQSLSD